MAGAGAHIHVWSPGQNDAQCIDDESNLWRHSASFDPFSLIALDKAFGRFAGPLKIILQYAPHGYGLYGINLIFAAWILKRALINSDQIDLMIHEPYLAFSGSLKQKIAALIQRAMLGLIFLAAQKIWISTSLWNEQWPLKKAAKKGDCLPVGSNINVKSSEGEVECLKDRFGGKSRFTMGHFSSFNNITLKRLEKIIPAVFKALPESSVVLIGKNGERAREYLSPMIGNDSHRLFVSGTLNVKDTSFYIQACDAFLQPYPEGVNSRYTSLLAVLSHGKPVVSNRGPMSEEIWGSAKGIFLADDNAIDSWINLLKELAEDAKQGFSYAQELREFYNKNLNRCLGEEKIKRFYLCSNGK